LQEASVVAPGADGYSAVPSSPSGGIRPLSLLRDRDTNASAGSPTSGTRPLLLGKKKKTTRADKADAENKGLKPLALSRTDTTKERGLLRKIEVIPTVVIRPPSTGEQSMHYGYNI
jgi:hypothetical protein